VGPKKLISYKMRVQWFLIGAGCQQQEGGRDGEKMDQWVLNDREEQVVLGWYCIVECLQI
jgi:hypothetical protein